MKGDKNKMSTAKERYYSLIEDFEIGVLQEIIDYVTELEQDLKDSELRRKDLLTSLRRANAQKAELEQEKAELIDGIEKIKSLCKSKAVNNHLDQIFIISDIMLNKHTDKPDAL